MLLKELIGCSDEKMGMLNITGVTCDSRQVREGVAFVCIRGTKSDGHDFAKAALQQGAAVVIVERDLGLERQCLVPDTHAAFAVMSANWFGNPSRNLHLIGVTGTKGKTSTTFMIKKILESVGHKVGLIGTIQHMIGEEAIESKNTTPSAYELNELFAEMVNKDCDYVVMEVSSHALDQCRVYALEFEVAVFTNLTQDHLDYHKTMENYLDAKKRLFRMCRTAVINQDDPYAADIMKDLTCKVVTYSMQDSSTYSAKGVYYYPARVEYEWVSDSAIQHIRVNTGGKFTVYNSMAAITAAVEMGIPVERAGEAIVSLDGVKGRAEVVPCDRDFTVIIDYAHTPDGLKNILSTFRECPKNRLIVLFGCGGDRDKTKRPIMGAMATRYADFVIVTSDNPRTEDPDAIIADIVGGIEGTNTPYKVIPNRVEAIRYALSAARKDDIIVLAGKGHETYQILKTGTIHLDEREVVRDALREMQ